MRIMGRQNAHYKGVLRFFLRVYVFLRVFKEFVKSILILKKSPKATSWGGGKIVYHDLFL